MNSSARFHLYLRPNDDEEWPPGRDGSVHQQMLGATTYQPGHDGEHSASPIGEQNQSEGNVGSYNEVPIFQNDLPSVTEEVGLRMS
ncbi:hypothetical protein Tco_0372487 [Tanacetum coccineum]